MAGSPSPTPTVASGAAAAIVTRARLPEWIRAQFPDAQKFVVHPFVAEVSSTDQLLAASLGEIYSQRKSLPASSADSQFSELTQPATIRATTTSLVASMALQMSKKNANPGILFGFCLRLNEDAAAHGVIKADLDDERRFHLEVLEEQSWSIDEVRELLPPKSIYAKFAISPQPNEEGNIGVHDVSDSSSAADYFLSALGLVVPKERGTQAAVARAAAKAGYTTSEIRRKLKELDQDRGVEEYVAEAFPRIPEADRVRLRGPSNRPMRTIRASENPITTFKTEVPHFKLEVDKNVEVSINGREITVTLPENSSPIAESTRGDA